MSYFEQDLITILTGESSITDVIGTRIYFEDKGDCNTYPLTVFFRIDTTPYSTHDDGEGLSYIRVQFNHIGETFEQSKLAANAFRAFLSGYKTTINGKQFSSLRDDERSSIEGEQSIKITMQDFIIHYKEN